MRLSHPNLPKLYYSFQDGAKLYFVMEFCEKGEFSDFLRINSLNKLNVLFLSFHFIIRKAGVQSHPILYC